MKYVVHTEKPAANYNLTAVPLNSAKFTFHVPPLCKSI